MYLQRRKTIHNQLANQKPQSTVRSIRALAPLLDRVLVQRVKAETKTAGGIFLPESSVEKLNEAKVLAVGPGGLDRDGKRVAMSVAVGDRVLIPQVGRRRGQKEKTKKREADINSMAALPSSPAKKNTTCSVTASR